MTIFLNAIVTRTGESGETHDQQKYIHTHIHTHTHIHSYICIYSLILDSWEGYKDVSKTFGPGALSIYRIVFVNRDQTTSVFTNQSYTAAIEVMEGMISRLDDTTLDGFYDSMDAVMSMTRFHSPMTFQDSLLPLPSMGRSSRLKKVLLQSQLLKLVRVTHTHTHTHTPIIPTCS